MYINLRKIFQLVIVTMMSIPFFIESNVILASDVNIETKVQSHANTGGNSGNTETGGARAESRVIQNISGENVDVSAEVKVNGEGVKQELEKDVLNENEEVRIEKEVKNENGEAKVEINITNNPADSESGNKETEDLIDDSSQDSGSWVSFEKFIETGYSKTKENVKSFFSEVMSFLS